MGHGYRGSNNLGGGSGLGFQAFRRMPRGLKIFLVALVLVVLFIVLSVVGIIVLILVKAVSGGSLPGFLQGLMDFFQQNVQPLLDIWNQIQSVIGG